MSNKALAGGHIYDPETQRPTIQDGIVEKITNLPDSHPLMEARNGIKRYKEKPIDNEALRMKTAMEEMKAEVERLKGAMSVKAEPTPEAEGKISIATLRSRAKKIDPTVPGNASRATCEKVINDFFDEGDDVDGDSEA